MTLGTELSPEALSKRLDVLEGQITGALESLRHSLADISKRLDAVEGSRQRDCVIIGRDGMLANIGLYTPRGAQEQACSQQKDNPGGGPYLVRRLIPVEDT